MVSLPFFLEFIISTLIHCAKSVPEK